MTTKQGFKEIEHTADAALHVWGTTLTEMFQQAALGIYAMAGAQADDSSPIHRSIHLEADDLETLMVNFLSELLFFLDEGFLFQVAALQINQNKLDGELSGSRVVQIQKEIKAVTFHDLQIIRSENCFQTSIVLDI